MDTVGNSHLCARGFEVDQLQEGSFYHCASVSSFDSGLPRGVYKVFPYVHQGCAAESLPSCCVRPRPCQVPCHHLGCCVLPALGSLAECGRGGDWIAGTGPLPFESHALEVRRLSALTPEPPNPGSTTGPTAKGPVIVSETTPRAGRAPVTGRGGSCRGRLLGRCVVPSASTLQSLHIPSNSVCFMCSWFRPFQGPGVAPAPGLGDRPGPSLLLTPAMPAAVHTVTGPAVCGAQGRRRCQVQPLGR